MEIGSFDARAFDEESVALTISVDGAKIIEPEEVHPG